MKSHNRCNIEYYILLLYLNISSLISVEIYYLHLLHLADFLHYLVLLDAVRRLSSLPGDSGDVIPPSLLTLTTALAHDPPTNPSYYYSEQWRTCAP